MKKIGTRKLMLEEIEIDGTIQPRCRTDESVVAEYKAAMEEGAVFPALSVWLTSDGHYVLLGGFTRIAAYTLLGRQDADCDIYEGSKQEAMFRAIGDNARSGQQYSGADFKRIVGLMLADPVLAGESTRRLAQLAGLTWATCDKYRRELQPDRVTVRGSGRAVELPPLIDEPVDDEPVESATPNVAPCSAKPAPAKKPKPKDGNGKRLPDDLADVFNSVPQLIAISDQIKQARDQLLAIGESWNPFIDQAAVTRGADSLLSVITDATPFAACGCKSGCEACGGEKWLPEWKYNGG